MISRLDTLAHMARVTRQHLENHDLRELEDRTEFRGAWRRIVELFPEDFTPARGSDLARHIGFAQPHDFFDIEFQDIPAVQGSVQNYRRGGEENAIFAQEEFEIDFEPFQLLHPLIRDTSLPQFNDQNYSIAARSAVEVIMDEVRRISGQDGDGHRLINDVFGAGAGNLAFSPCSTESEISVSGGLKDMLLGIFRGIRNPLAHGWNGFTRIECFQIMVACSFLLARIELVEPHE
ncbi:TIGR02391 family protein [Hyphomonas johnsonii]|nr:TIGR02391 family protein [Hyphomonas johnsonii]